MKVSVITVSFNAAGSIAATLKSVLEQTYKNIEYIVVDGDSSDGSKKIIKQYETKISKVIIEPDNGLYDAMNKGLSRASGDIICFLNANDVYVSNDIIETVVKLFQTKKIEVLMGDVGFSRRLNSKRIWRRYRSATFRPSKLSWGWMPAHPAFFLHKAVVDRVGCFNTKYKIAADFDYVIRVFNATEVRYFCFPKIMVLMSAGGKSDKLTNKLILNREVLNACRMNGLKSNIFKILSKYPIKVLEYFFVK